jgi:hypothetical protein
MEPELWIIEHQLGRRNLTDAARIELAMCKEKMSKSSKANKARKSADIRQSVAENAGVSVGTVQNYNQVKKHGSPELLEQVKSGKIKIGKARKMLDSNTQIFKQLKAADKALVELKEFLTNEAPDENDQLYERLEKVAEKMKEAMKEDNHA